jgi:hypothetical protein
LFRRRQLSLQCGTNSSRMRQSLTGGGRKRHAIYPCNRSTKRHDGLALLCFSYPAARV